MPATHFVVAFALLSGLSASAQSFGSTAGAGTTSLPCPTAKPAAVATAAPTPQEFAALIKSLVSTYGTRLGPGKNVVDAAVGKESNTSGIAGALFVSGAASASVYTSALAVQKNPADVQAAGNLGVALDTIPDSAAATKVLLYARYMNPTSGLAALNLAWAYYNAGNAPLAQKHFQEASQLAPDLAGSYAGLGLLASCRGDQATALIQFRRSLSKSYSGLVAAGYRKAKEQTQHEDKYDAGAPDKDPDSGPVPELPVSETPSVTAASEEAFEHALQFTNEHVPAAYEKAREAFGRLMAIERRRRENPDGTIDLPRLFDKQVFMFGEIVELTVAQTVKLSAEQWQGAAKVIEPTMEQAAGQAGIAAEKSLKQMDEVLKAQERSLACVEGCPGKCGSKSSCLGPCVEACGQQLRKEIDPLERELNERAYLACKQAKSATELLYAQQYKVWKQFSDSLRVSARDLYAFSDPYFEQIWVPALHDLMEAQRELVVLSLYQQAAGQGSSLANLGKSLRDMKCVEPPPPAPPKTAKDPDLKKSKADCPLNPPLKLGAGALSFSLGCDKFSISGGEVLRFKFERNFVKKESAAHIGVGASVGAGIDLGSGKGLGESKNGWTPPGMSAGASITAEIMIGIRASDAGGLQDVSLTSTVAASGNSGIAKGAVGVTGSVSLENGANLTPIMDYGRGAGKIDIPGLPGGSWTPGWK